MQESAGGDHVAAHNKAGKPAKSPAAALGEASQAGFGRWHDATHCMHSGKTYSAWHGAELSKIQHGNSRTPQTERAGTHCEVGNAAWMLRNRRRNKALTARRSESGGEIDLEGSAACDRLRFPDVYRYGRRSRDGEAVSKNKTFRT